MFSSSKVNFDEIYTGNKLFLANKIIIVTGIKILKENMIRCFVL